MFIITCLSTVAFAATPSIVWEQQYGTGAGNSFIHSVWQTSDGGFILAGTQYVTGENSPSMWLVKTDANGQQQWAKNYPEAASSRSEGYSVRQTSDGGFIVAGMSDSLKAWLVKTDFNGNEQWNKNYDSGTKLYSVQQTGDGGYIAAGTPNNGGILLIKTDTNGNVQWEKTFGDNAYETGYGVWPTSDGGYAVIGEGWPSGSRQLWLIRTDASGNKQWEKYFDDDCPNTCGYAIQQTRDGGFILAGQYMGYSSMWLVKTDANGNKVWENTFDDIGTSNSLSVQQAWDDGYVIGGYLLSSDTLTVTVVRTDASGKIQWTKSLKQSVTHDSNQMTSVQQIGDGSFVIGSFAGENLDASKYGYGYFVQLASDMTPVPNAQLVSDSIPTTWDAGKTYTVSVTFLNSGTKPWTYQDNTTMSPLPGSDAAKFGATTNQTVQIGTVVRPGQQYTFSFAMTAPAMNGTYNPKFQMVWEGHQLFGALDNKTIRVVNGTPNPDETAGQPAASPTAPPTSGVTASPSGTVAPTQTTTPTETPASTAKGSGMPCLSSVIMPLLIVGTVAIGLYRQKNKEN